MTAGSKWRKWDLHVHTPASDGGDFDAKIKQLENAEAEAIGINDYCTVAGYKEITSRGGVKEKVLFPVVEFRMNNILKSRSGEDIKINFHIIFTNDPAKMPAIETWLNSLDCVVEQGKKKKLGSIDPKKTNLNKLSFDYIGIIDNLKGNSDLRDHSLVWLPYNEYGGIDEVDPDSDEYFKTGLISRADFLGCANSPQIDFFLWKSAKHDPEQIKNWLGNRKIACLKGSDTHDCNYPVGKLRDKDSKPADKYCWIKADKTFEGLRQVVFEPQYRVSISQKPPQDPLRWIRGMKLDFPQSTKVGGDPFCFRGKHDISLSPNLTCFIGGRGTGKSTALSLLYELLTPGVSTSQIVNDLEIGAKKSLTDCATVEGSDQIEYVEFLSQNEIEEFASDHNKFTAAIYQRLTKYDHGGKLASSQSALDTAVAAMDTQIQDLLLENTKRKLLEEKNRILQSNKNIVSSIKSTEYTDINAEIETLTRKSKRISRAKKQYQDLMAAIEGLSEGSISLPEDANSYEVALHEVTTALSALVAKPRDFAQVTREEDELKTKIENQRARLVKFLETRKLSQEDLNDISGANERIIETTEEIQELEKDLEAIRKRIQEFEVDRIRTARLAYETEIKKQIQPVSEQLQDLGSEVKPIRLAFGFDEERARKALLEEFQVLFKKVRVDYLEQYLFKTSPLEITTQEEFIKAIKGTDKNLNKTQQTLLDLFSDETSFAMFKLLAEKVYSEQHRFLMIEVTYDSKPLWRCSFGQRCTAAIIILLLLGNTPIIIDEPEAHLDSSLVANYLVEAIKERKQTRQIVFATHNANFVVNGDAELVNILTTSADGSSVITPSTIEDLDHRKELVALEGGVEAFEMRGEKYNVEHRLRV